MNAIRNYRRAAIGALAVIALAGCSTSTTDDADTTAAAQTVAIEDNFGEQTVTTPPKSVVATDNSTFETLDSWGVDLSAGAVSLMPNTIGYKQDSDVVDLGTHREPNLEAVVAAEPDLIINGGRFAQFLPGGLP